MKIHKFTDTGSAYDGTQCGISDDGDEVKNGDILIIEPEGVVGVANTWPFAVTVAPGNLHTFAPSPLTEDVKKKFGPYIIRAVGQAVVRGWPVRPEMLALLTPVDKYLRCSCCGASTPGRQWSNRDEGYGVCNRCIDDCTTEGDWLEAGSPHGIPGVHYDLDGTHFRSKQA